MWRKGWGISSAMTITMSSAHSPTFPSLHLRHSSFSNPSIALPTSQLILQPFRCFTYVTAHSATLLSLLLRHRLFTWRAAHAKHWNERLFIAVQMRTILTTRIPSRLQEIKSLPGIWSLNILLSVSILNISISIVVCTWISSSTWSKTSLKNTRIDAGI